MDGIVKDAAWTVLSLLLVCSGCAGSGAGGTGEAAPPYPPLQNAADDAGSGLIPPATGAGPQDLEHAAIYFAFDSHALSPESVETLAGLSAYLADNTEVTLTVEGHCDERGTRAYNLALGERRAHAAREYLVSSGISSARIDTISYGEEMPADTGRTEEAWSRNRRDRFVLGN